MESLRPLLGRTLVLVAHPDDEAVGCGALLQRMKDPIVIFATDGAPRANFFWHNHGSRQGYARARATEAHQALAAAGVRHFHFLCESQPIVDQELYQQLDRAYEALAVTIESEMPSAILTMAYEGGHPDHDACALLATAAAKRYELPVWEMPLYHRRGDHMQRQIFVDEQESFELDMTREELVRKLNMFSAYNSQAEVLREFLPYVEWFRPAKLYDFLQAPHLGELNYEAWQWPMKGADLCREFTKFLEALPGGAKRREWGTAA